MALTRRVGFESLSGAPTPENRFMITRNRGKKFIRAVLPVILGAAFVAPLGAQQSDPTQQNTATSNSFATPSPTVSPGSRRDNGRRKHQRKHRGKRRQGRGRDQNGAMTRQRDQARDRQQNGAGTVQDRQQQTDVTPAATGSEEKAAPENVLAQPDAVPQPTPH